MIFAIDVLINIIFFRFFFFNLFWRKILVFFLEFYFYELYASNLMKTNDDSHRVAQ